jgi:hypothetical protein
MKKIILFLPIATSLLFLIMLFSCRNKTREVTTSIPSVDTLITKQLAENNQNDKSKLDQQDILVTLDSIFSLASVVVESKNQIKYNKHIDFISDPNDSLIFSEVENKTFKVILEYKKKLLSGVKIKGELPGITHFKAQNDTLAFKILQEVKPSLFQNDKSFYFLGGGPFLKEYETEKGEFIFQDPDGNPELRYYCTINDNTKYILNAVLHLRKERINLLFGPPLDSYDTGPVDVKGIGSLIHEFVYRIPVLFLTEEGIINGYLLSIKNKLVPEQLGCRSDNPEVTFAFSVTPEEILGVYIPYDLTISPTCSIKRKDKVWTADLNSDGIPEFASISETYIGINSDNMIYIVWYANINGKWIMIDKAVEPDCT